MNDAKSNPDQVRSGEWETGYRTVECDCGKEYEINQRFSYNTDEKDKYDSRATESRIKLNGDDQVYVLDINKFVRCPNCACLINYLGLNSTILN